jgi:hypothetical protein
MSELRGKINSLPPVKSVWPVNRGNLTEGKSGANIAAFRHISRQRPKYAHATIEKVLQELFSMWSAPCPLLDNESLNTFPRQRIRRQQLDNFSCYAARCKYNRGRGVFYGSTSRLYKQSSRKSEVSRRKRTRMERVLSSRERKVRLKIDCELL